ncbi:MAG: hypothetical protein FJ109_00165 [Deltaproteobacteria bacterium]|nr:hypothetical protein [Deltaproteobacteria bacterium]
MKSNPKRQGGLDGLCGVYAVVNAIGELTFNGEFGRERQQELFNLLVRTVYRRLPQDRKSIRFVWDGTSPADVNAMVETAGRFARRKLGFDLEWCRGLSGSGMGKKIQSFWKELDSHLTSDQKGAAIVVYDDDDISHWTCVVDSTGKQLRLRDSAGFKTLKKQGGTLGSRRSGQRQYWWNDVFLLSRGKPV